MRLTSTITFRMDPPLHPEPIYYSRMLCEGSPLFFYSNGPGDTNGYVSGRLPAEPVPGGVPGGQVRGRCA